MNNRKMISAEDARKETKYRVRLKIIDAIFEAMDRRPGSTHCVVMNIIPYDDVLEEFQKEGYTITIFHTVFDTNDDGVNIRVSWGE